MGQLPLRLQGESEGVREQGTLKFVAAIDRIADVGSLNVEDMHFLVELADKSPRAVDHAFKFLTSWLGDPILRAESRRSGIDPCIEILLSAPQVAKPLESRVLEILIDREGPHLSLENKTGLQNLVDVLAKIPD